MANVLLLRLRLPRVRQALPALPALHLPHHHLLLLLHVPGLLLHRRAETLVPGLGAGLAMRTCSATWLVPRPSPRCRRPPGRLASGRLAGHPRRRACRPATQALSHQRRQRRRRPWLALSPGISRGPRGTPKHCSLERRTATMRRPDIFDVYWLPMISWPSLSLTARVDLLPSGIVHGIAKPGGPLVPLDGPGWEW